MPDPAADEKKKYTIRYLASDDETARQVAVGNLVDLLEHEDKEYAQWALNTLREQLSGKGSLDCKVVESTEHLGCPDSQIRVTVECTRSGRGRNVAGDLRWLSYRFDDEQHKTYKDLMDLGPACKDAAKGLATPRCLNLCPEGPTNIVEDAAGSGSDQDEKAEKVTCWVTQKYRCDGVYGLDDKRGKAANSALVKEDFGAGDAKIKVTKRIPSCPGIGWLKICAKKPIVGGVGFTDKGAGEMLKNAIDADKEITCPDKCETKIVHQASNTDDDGNRCHWYAVVCTVPGEAEPEIPPIPDDLYSIGPRTGRRGRGAMRYVAGPVDRRAEWMPTWEVARALHPDTSGVVDQPLDMTMGSERT